MTPGIWMAGCATASLIVSIGTIFYTWYASRQRATQRELDVIREKVSEIDAKRAADKGEMRDRIVRVEAEVENLPNHSQMAALTENIQQVRGDVGGVRDMIGMLGMRIERVDNYLMSEKGNR